MANLTTTVRDPEGQELFRMAGRIPAETILLAAQDHAERLSRALEDVKRWEVTTQRGSTPAKSYEELHDG